MPLRITGRDEGSASTSAITAKRPTPHGDGAILVKPKESAIAHGAADVVAVAESGGGL